MATQFAQNLAPSPPVPFMLRTPREPKPVSSFEAALRTAVAAERLRGDIRNPRQRIANFLCELGKAYDCRRLLPLSRGELAGLLGISLVRVKRTLALLCLSGVIAADGDTITVLDWRKLSGAARFDAASLGLGDEEDDASCGSSDDEAHPFTASGEPACFV